MVCVRCGAEEAINSRKDGKRPGLVRSLGWTCGGCGGDECGIKEAEEEKALPVVGLFSRFSSCEEMVRSMEAQREKTMGETTKAEKDEPKVEERLRRKYGKTEMTPKAPPERPEKEKKKARCRVTGGTQGKDSWKCCGCFRQMPCRFMSDCDDCGHLACDGCLRCVILELP